ncbi:MAG: type II toxin-antitoxin system YafQ family toxin [Terrimicrobiaceae bacterium]
MRETTYTSQFKRDYKKRSRERGLDAMIEHIVELLAAGKPLDVKLRDHAFKGGYAGCRECHLKPDLLLIYVLTKEELRMVRLGSHSELFA